MLCISAATAVLLQVNRMDDFDVYGGKEELIRSFLEDKCVLNLLTNF